jgi:hypothetical protein
MIRADRELLAELARVNTDVVPLAMRILDDSATREEQQTLAERLIEVGIRLNRRADDTVVVIDSDTDGLEKPHTKANGTEAPFRALRGGSANALE